ncbi:MAG: M20/M25/M40 family metallo-hydrolase [Clostridia bacterium]|nr:M20/M25/M40 family metallo-hydrolase [Clostridia bacterium]
MKILFGILIGLAAVVVLFLAVVLIRTLRFKPRQQIEPLKEAETVDRERLVSALQTLIKFKTVSYMDSSLEDDGEFEGLVESLSGLYPYVTESCKLTRFEGRGLLYHWKGNGNGSPLVLMAHYDVVPVNAGGWSRPAFEGIVEDGVIWGRGTLDTKVTFSSIFYAADKLISEGFIPENDIYLAFSGSEEIAGVGASRIVDYFESQGIVPSMVLDEGGAVVENVFPGVSAPCGLVGIAEKGSANVKYTARSTGGHASAPKPHTPVGVLAQACVNIENKPFPFHISDPARKMFDTLGRHSSFAYRMIFANLWCFSPILDIMCKKSGGEFNALMRTTVAFTKMSGSTAENVIPPEATMVSNIRLNPYDTVETAVRRLKKAISNEAVEVSVINGMDPSRISVTDIPEWDKLSLAIRSTWDGAIVSPYLMVQCSDSRNYGRISDRVYRFSAMDLTAEERATIHGHDERLRVDVLCRAAEFFVRLIKMF